MGSTDSTQAPGQAPGGQFPMATTIDDALPLLRRPFSPSAVRAKVQNQDRAKPPNWGQIARYIDARLVTERLNLVVGGRWRYQYAPLDPALWPEPDEDDDKPPPLFVTCSLTVLGQTHTDVGEGRDPKAAYSDALKRAAVPFGIGRSIYAVPRRFLFAEEAKRPPRDKLKRRGERLYLTDANELMLREEYERWLAEVGIAAFGEPLDHGPDQAGTAEEDGDQAEDAAAPLAGAEAPTGGLRAVSDGSPQEAPATIHERKRLMALIAAADYSEQTVKELAALTLGERLLDRLSARQVGELERMLSAASAAAIDDQTLATRVKSATEQSGGGEGVRRGLDALVTDGQQGDRRRAA